MTDQIETQSELSGHAALKATDQTETQLTELSGHAAFKVIDQIETQSELSGQAAFKVTDQIETKWTELSGHAAFKATDQTETLWTELSAKDDLKATDQIETQWAELSGEELSDSIPVFDTARPYLPCSESTAKQAHEVARHEEHEHSGKKNLTVSVDSSSTNLILPLTPTWEQIGAGLDMTSPEDVSNLEMIDAGDCDVMEAEITDLPTEEIVATEERTQKESPVEDSTAELAEENKSNTDDATSHQDGLLNDPQYQGFINALRTENTEMEVKLAELYLGINLLYDFLVEIIANVPFRNTLRLRS